MLRYLGTKANAVCARACTVSAPRRLGQTSYKILGSQQQRWTNIHQYRRTYTNVLGESQGAPAAVEPSATPGDLLTQYSRRIPQEPTAVISELSQYLSNNPDSVDALLLRAAAYEKIQEFSQAATDLEAAVSKAPSQLVKDRKLHYHLAEAYRQSDQYDLAIQAIDKGLAAATSEESFATHQYARAVIEMDQANFKAALKDFLEVKQFYDKTDDKKTPLQLLENIGQCYGSLDEYDNAYRYLMEAHLKGCSLSAQSFTLLGSLAQAFHSIYNNNFEAAFQWFQLALMQDDTDPTVHVQLALLYSMKQDTQLALEHINKVFMFNGGEDILQSAFFRSAAWCYCREGALDKARAIVAGMKARFPDSGDTYIASARLQQAEGDTPAALREFEQGLHKAPSLELYVKYIMALVNNQQYEDAVVMLEQAQERKSLYDGWAEEKFSKREVPSEFVGRQRWLTTFLHPNNRVYPHYSEEFVWAMAQLSDGFSEEAEKAFRTACELAPNRKSALQSHYTTLKRIIKPQSSRRPI